MHVEESEIYEPLENSDLKSIIPIDERILFSAIFEVNEFGKEAVKTRSHVILTNKGVAISSSAYISLLNSGGIKIGDLYYYFPWHTAKISSAYSNRLLIGETLLRMERNKDVETIKPYDIIEKELNERIKLLIKHSKDLLYEKLIPILKSYPKKLLPLNNTSRYPMLNFVYTELRNRFIKEVKKGKKTLRSNIIRLPKSFDKSSEEIIFDIKNYNFAEGTYDEVKKIEEMVLVFTNFFGNHPLEEAIDLILKLFDINTILVSKWYPKAITKILYRFSKKEKSLYELERIIAEEKIFKFLFKKDEYIIVDFKGQVNLPNAHFEYPGHIYLTNYQLIFPSIPKAKTLYYSGLITGLVATGTKAHIVKARKKFNNVLVQNPDLFCIKNPYNIELNESLKNKIRFKMNYDYIDEISKEKKKYEVLISIMINKLNKTSSANYNQIIKEVLSKFADFFSQFPNTVCPKCFNIQDKSLKECEMCGRSLSVLF